MRCRDVLRLASDYVDGELDNRRSSAVRGHLRTCTECERAVTEIARVRDAAAELEPLDPPPSLWAGIEQRLATAEIRDAHRSRLWLWWQAVKPQLPYAAVAGAGAVLLAVWLTRGREPAPEAAPRSAAALRTQRTEIRATASNEPAVEESHGERETRELRESDEKYLATIDELRGMAAEERAEWSADQTRRYDQRIAEFDRVTLEHRKRLALADTAGPRDSDTLFALYQAEIEFLLDATLGEL